MSASTTAGDAEIKIQAGGARLGCALSGAGAPARRRGSRYSRHLVYAALSVRHTERTRKGGSGDDTSRDNSNRQICYFHVHPPSHRLPATTRVFAGKRWLPWLLFEGAMRSGL